MNKVLDFVLQTPPLEFDRDQLVSTHVRAFGLLAQLLLKRPKATGRSGGVATARAATLLPRSAWGALGKEDPSCPEGNLGARQVPGDPLGRLPSISALLSARHAPREAAEPPPASKGGSYLPVGAQRATASLD